ncbi:MAG: SUMF1/EgtB/PvdO family nonheme iron enzyme [Chitinivibrionales bacterium]|nr:SUMF1/EgtB/PvdO family nonheme iron enzyme [Chitinivibrionales bacterium]
MISTKPRTLTFLLSAAIAAFWCCCTDDTVGPTPERVGLTITADSGGTVSGTPADSMVNAGTAVTLTAIPDSGYAFAGWSGSIVSAANPLTLTVTADLSIHAAFAALTGDMRPIQSSGTTFTMGSSSALAVQNERPPHPVRFTYDFAVGVTEITQVEYERVMGAGALADVLGSAQAGVGDSLPVYNVTWYDAVRYCNARSRLEGLDSVYTYTAVCPDGVECPYVLENLTIAYERFGYRLPTEAEWELACRAGTTTDYYWGDIATAPDSAGRYAWYSFNADGAKAVAGKHPNAYGLYDMAGNVGEWVNDWLAPYDSDEEVDPVGPRHLSPVEFERDWERPVRGGSWELGTAYLRSSSRTGPYQTAAKFTSASIGFRIALGAFEPDSSGTWDPAPDTLGKPYTVAYASRLIDAIGTAAAKLVFTQTSGGIPRLYFVDFSSPDLRPVMLPDTLPVIAPTISPDGRFVAYGTKRAGFESGSRMTVRRLDTTDATLVRSAPSENAFLPRWWTSDTAQGTYLIYAEGASLNDNPRWESERTLRRLVNGLNLGAPEVLTARGSFHGGLSADGRFLATGYPRALVLDLDQNVILPYFGPPHNGLTDTVQVCNVSISPSVDETDNILLLDFGTRQTSTVVGRPYGLHEILFMCTSAPLTDHVRKWFAIPADGSSWNDVEYSNHPDAAVGLAEKPDTQSVVLIDLADSAYVELVRGPGLRDPYLWIDPQALPQAADPYRFFARYDLPTFSFGQPTLHAKMKLFWKRRASLECVAMGSSLVHYGIDISHLGVPALSMGTCNADQYGGIVLTREFLLRHCPDLKAVVMDLGAGFLRGDPYPETPYVLSIGDTKGYALDRENAYWENGIPPAVQERIEAFDSTDWPDLDTNGSQPWVPAMGWGEPIFDLGDYTFNDTFVQLRLSHLARLGDTLATRGIHLLMVRFPQNPLYATTGMAGRYGPSDSTFAQVEAWFDDQRNRNAYFHYYDAHRDGSHDYTDNEAFDASHLSTTGARKLTTRIDSVLRAAGAW